MFHLLLIDVAACVALIMVAVLIMVRRWQQRSGWSLIPARWRRRAAAGQDAQGLASRPAAVIPGLTDGREPDRGPPRRPGAAHAAQAGQGERAAHAARSSRAARPAHATPMRPDAQPQRAAYAHPATQPMPAAVRAERGTQPLPAAVQAEQGTQPMEAVQAEPGRPPRPATRAEQATRAQQSAQPPRFLNVPGAAARERPRPARPATSADRIGSYYDEADRQMSDYLAKLGWDDEPGPDGPQ